MVNDSGRAARSASKPRTGADAVRGALTSVGCAIVLDEMSATHPELAADAEVSARRLLGSVTACAGPESLDELADEMLTGTGGLGVTIPDDTPGRFWPRWTDLA